MRTSHVILCLNSGSSSLKFGLYRLSEGTEALLASGAVERIGLPDGRLWVRDGEREVLADASGDFSDHAAAVQATFQALRQLELPSPVAVGHRVVHGGADYAAHQPVTPQLVSTLRTLIPLAPLHLPGALQGMQSVTTRFPGLPQVACFDTAFHRRMPEIAQRFPLPADLWEDGVRRYGFHGLSYEYILETLGPAARGRVIIAHLGNGASMAAVRDGAPLDTTMGFTPTGGFMMGTRSGDLDPGVVLYLLNEKGYDAPRLDQLVNHQAGLLGVSGISPDMKTLLEQREGAPSAAQAVALFCYQARKQIGALTAALGGLDTLVFTGGIGERAAPVRWEICRGLECLGIHLDRERNAAHTDPISTARSRCTVRVIPTNEDLMIARHTRNLLVSAPTRPMG